MSEILNGVINVYKPAGITSNGVVTRIRKLTGIKKVGHTGTLDPEARGVLPICIGKATKVAGMLTDAHKGYRTKIKLGITTDTQDLTGNVLTEHEVNISEEEFLKTVESFVGEISQVPPMYSALKHNGQPLYKLARKGIEIERKPRIITIFDIKVTGFSGTEATFEVFCSKGTYIRTLCADIGEKLGVGAVMAELERIKSGPFDLENSIKLELLEENPDLIEENIISPDALFNYEKITVNKKLEEKIKNGQPVKVSGTENNVTYKVYGPEENFLCISKAEGDLLKMVQSFY